MDLDFSNCEKDTYLKKYSFNSKVPGSDGSILQIHNSYFAGDGETKKCRFMYFSFNDIGDHLALADHKGNIFVIDLEKEKYWQIPYIGLPTLISFLVIKSKELLIGLDTTAVLVLHIETGEVTGVLTGHSFPPTDVSYSNDGVCCLTSCVSEAIIWELTTFSQMHRLSLKSDMSIKKVVFVPVTNHIFACFHDDSMLVWKFGSFECIKQIIPKTWKNNHLKAIAFTKNGKTMVIGGHDSTLVLFCLEKWIIKKVIEFPENIGGVKQMEFIPKVFDGGSSKTLAILTTSLEIYFFDLEASVFLKGISELFGMAVKISLSNNGRYLAIILSNGAVHIYEVEKLLSGNSNSDSEKKKSKKFLKINSSNLSFNCSTNRTRSFKSVGSLAAVQKQLKDLLNVKKLVPILKQYGEYPATYRVLIWKTLLELPSNEEAFISLSFKKCHPSYRNLESKYPLENKSMCTLLKKILSNLSHWCPLFSEVGFLPEFVFPFVKLFHFDPLACFEAISTILVNWCQNWFEFYPIPPINLLAVLENIIGHHEPDLLEFYMKNNITSNIYVSTLFHTVFSEVLSEKEWLRLWDHILSNEPSFFFLAIIAYNAVCKKAIKTLKESSEVEKFFHRQNPIDMKMFISKIYNFLKETPAEIHTRQYFCPFRSLGKGGTYIPFVYYPKPLIDCTVEKLQSFRKEEQNILIEQMQALSLKHKLEEKLEKENEKENRKKIFIELEEKIRKTVAEEEDRVLSQRQKLNSLRKELRLKKLDVLEDVKKKAMEERINRKELEYKRLLEDISKRKAREKADVDMVEEEINNYYSELLLRKYQLELIDDFNEERSGLNEDLEFQRKKLKEELLNLQNNELDSWRGKERIKASHKIAIAKDLINEVEAELTEKLNESNRYVIDKLKENVRLLEDEMEKLLLEKLNKIQKMKDLSSDPTNSQNQFIFRDNEDKIRMLKKRIVPTEENFFVCSCKPEMKRTRPEMEKLGKSVSMKTAPTNLKKFTEVYTVTNRPGEENEKNDSFENAEISQEINEPPEGCVWDSNSCSKFDRPDCYNQKFVNFSPVNLEINGSLDGLKEIGPDYRSGLPESKESLLNYIVKEPSLKKFDDVCDVFKLSLQTRREMVKEAIRKQECESD